MQRAVVTGAGGFIGRHLTAKLEAAGCEVVGFGRGSDGRAKDVSDWSVNAIAERLHSFRPNVIFHLAGTASAYADELTRINVGLTRTLVAAIAASHITTVLVSAASAAEYGAAIEDGVPVREDATCRPLSPYGRSKLAQSEILYDFAASSACRVIAARIFNPIGEGMPPHLALGSFARQIASMKGAGGILRTGNLEVYRDFIDVDDCVELLVALSQSADARGVFNVCRGDPVLLRSLVEKLICVSGQCIVLEQQAHLRRDGELQTIIGSTVRLSTVCTVPAPSDMRATMQRIWGWARNEAQGSREQS